MKKLMSVLLVVFLLATMLVTPAMADDPAGTITIDHAHEGHVYHAFQIFSGDLHGGVLSNVEWGRSSCKVEP